MEIKKIHFSKEPTNLCDYRMQDDGFAEVWLFDNIQQDEEDWTADGIFLRTMLTQEEIEAHKAKFFVVEAPTPTIEERVDVLESTSDDIILMMAELIGGE